MSLPAWKDYLDFTLTNSNSTDVIDYQFKLNFDSSDFDFSRANSDGSDIRFLNSDDRTPLSYWIESWDSSEQTATVWVKASVSANSSKKIRMYFGNPIATSESNGFDTFLLFSDFNADHWLNLGGATHSVSHRQMSCSNINTEGIVYRDVVFDNNISFRFRVISAATGWWGSCVIHNDGTNVVSGYLIDISSVKAWNIWYGDGTRWNLIGNNIPSLAQATWVEIRRYGDNIKVLVNEAEIASVTDGNLTDGRVGFRQIISRDKVVDDVIVRKYVDMEPTYTIGSIRTSATNTNALFFGSNF